MSILVTRPSPAGEELVSRLRTLGQVAWSFPLIEFSPSGTGNACFPTVGADGERSGLRPLAARRYLCRCRASAAREKLAIPSAVFCHWPYNGAGAAYC